MPIFNKEAKDYDSFYTSKLGQYVDRVEKDLVYKFIEHKEGKVLDVGCGTGNFTLELSKKGYQMTGIDIAEEMLEIAKKKTKIEGQAIDFHLMNVEDLSFPDNSFDMVLTVTALEFIKDIDKAFHEMMRVLKPGACLIIGTINRESSWGDFYMSPPVRDNSVFKYAKLKTVEDLEKLDPGRLVDIGESLFLSPDTREEDLNLEKEIQSQGEKNGGFICAKWIK